jgi:uncharacterized protein YktA (UPF0223 family)
VESKQEEGKDSRQLKELWRQLKDLNEVKRKEKKVGQKVRKI